MTSLRFLRFTLNNLRVVFVDVDVVQRRLLQAEHVDHGPVQDVVGLGKELVEAPTFLLIGLQDVGEDRSEEALQTPEQEKAPEVSSP